MTATPKKDDRVKVIHKENGGVSSARMAGIAVATGEWIGFADGDGYAEPEMFAHLLENAKKYNGDISHCGYQMVFPDGHIDYYYNTGRLEILDHDTGVQALVHGEFVEPGLWNKLFRREGVMGFEESPLWDSSIRINEDLLMNYILFSRASSSVYEDLPLYHYVLRKGSAATSKKPARHKVQDPVRVMRTILEDAAHKPELYLPAAERYLRVLISAAQQKDWPEEAAEARREIKVRLKSFQKLQGISRKILLMAYGIAYAGPLYKLTRYVHDCITGMDKKYDLG